MTCSPRRRALASVLLCHRLRRRSRRAPGQTVGTLVRPRPRRQRLPTGGDLFLGPVQYRILGFRGWVVTGRLLESKPPADDDGGQFRGDSARRSTGSVPVSGGSGLGAIHWVRERTSIWIHGFRRLRTRGERRDDILEALLKLVYCMIICRRVRNVLLAPSTRLPWCRPEPCDPRCPRRGSADSGARPRCPRQRSYAWTPGRTSRRAA